MAEQERPDRPAEAQDEQKDSKPKGESLKTILKILGNTGFVLFLLLFIFFFVYFTLANLAFFGVLPKKLSYSLPVINRIVKSIEVKEKRIKWAQEQLEDQAKIRQIGRLQIDLSEDEEFESEGRKVPFLYKLRVVRNKIENKELAEIWVDNILVMRFYVGIGENSPYVRAKYVVKKINELLNNESDFNQLMPVLEDGEAKAKLDDVELFRVRKEDAIFNNSQPMNLLYSWVNNVRVALGASLLQIPKFIVKQKDLPKPVDQTGRKETPSDKKDAQSVPAKIESPRPAEKKPVEPAREPLPEDKAKRLKKVAEVYEKMPVESVSEILPKLKDTEVGEILNYLSIKKIAKLFVEMPGHKVASYYRAQIKGSGAISAKNFKKFVQVWEKIQPTDVLNIWKNLKTEEKTAILQKMSVKKKAKVLAEMPVNEAKRFLQQLVN